MAENPNQHIIDWMTAIEAFNDTMYAVIRKHGEEKEFAQIVMRQFQWVRTEMADRPIPAMDYATFISAHRVYRGMKKKLEIGLDNDIQHVGIFEDDDAPYTMGQRMMLTNQAMKKDFFTKLLKRNWDLPIAQMEVMWKAANVAVEEWVDSAKTERTVKPVV